MPHPKISTILNNCPFYVLTPALKQEIAQYAADDTYDNGHNANYNLLKNNFSDYYGINPLSWKDFSGILNNYNAFDVQIVLGPVLREFSKTMMNLPVNRDKLELFAIGNGMETEVDYIKATTEIDTVSGRYDSLGPEHLSVFAAAPLGLSITWNKTNSTTHIKTSRSILANEPVAAVSIHHHGDVEGAKAGGHWELVEEITNADNAADDTQLTPLLPLLGDMVMLNSGLTLQKKHVQLMHRYTKDNIDMTEGVNQIMQTSAQIERYMSNIMYVPKPLAKSLLGGSLTTETEDFIRNMNVDEIEIAPIFAQYLTAPKDSKPYVNAQVSEIITQLQQDIIIPTVFIPPVINDDPADIVAPATPEEPTDALESAYQTALQQLKGLKTQAHDTRLDESFDALVTNIEQWKHEGKIATLELTTALNKTYLRLTDRLSHKDYSNYANTVQGKSSLALKILGGLMLALSITAVVLGVVFFPAVVGLVAASLTLTGTAATIVAASTVGMTSAPLAGSGLGFFELGRNKGLSATMSHVNKTKLDIDAEVKQETETESKDTRNSGPK